MSDPKLKTSHKNIPYALGKMETATSKLDFLEHHVTAIIIPKNHAAIINAIRIAIDEIHECYQDDADRLSEAREIIADAIRSVKAQKKAADKKAEMEEEGSDF